MIIYPYLTLVTNSSHRPVFFSVFPFHPLKTKSLISRSISESEKVMLSFKLPTRAFAVWTIIVAAVAPASKNVHAQEYGSSQDPSSYGNVDSFGPTHIEMDYGINFDDKTTYGTVTHTMTVLQSNQNVVYFDVWDAVDVSMAEYKGLFTEITPPDVEPQVERAVGDMSDDGYMMVEFDITTPNPNIGNALAVTLPEAPVVGTVIYIRFTFMSLPSTTALDWLTPEMTADKTMPFVYSLCQMNFCRDWYVSGKKNASCLLSLSLFLPTPNNPLLS